jgi:XTP/dITP diphosphohydrolase
MAGFTPKSASQQAPARSRRQPLLLATGNPGKIREFFHLLYAVPYYLVTLKDVGLSDDVQEVGATLEENAALKARSYSRRSGLWAVADDSGLEVDALGGAPGPRSRRYAGPDASDAELVQLLLREMASVPPERRDGRFRCVIALASPHGNLSLFQGTCAGTIAVQPRGAGGFGYDPIFLLPHLGRTMAELSPEEKNRVSHRARAAGALVEALNGGRIPAER